MLIILLLNCSISTETEQIRKHKLYLHQKDLFESEVNIMFRNVSFLLDIINLLKNDRGNEARQAAVVLSDFDYNDKIKEGRSQEEADFLFFVDLNLTLFAFIVQLIEYKRVLLTNNDTLTIFFPNHFKRSSSESNELSSKDNIKSQEDNLVTSTYFDFFSLLKQIQMFHNASILEELNIFDHLRCKRKLESKILPKNKYSDPITENLKSLKEKESFLKRNNLLLKELKSISELNIRDKPKFLSNQSHFDDFHLFFKDVDIPFSDDNKSSLNQRSLDTRGEDRRKRLRKKFLTKLNPLAEAKTDKQDLSDKCSSMELECCFEQNNQFLDDKIKPTKYKKKKNKKKKQNQSKEYKISEEKSKIDSDVCLLTDRSQQEDLILQSGGVFLQSDDRKLMITFEITESEIFVLFNGERMKETEISEDGEWENTFYFNSYESLCEDYSDLQRVINMIDRTNPLETYTERAELFFSLRNIAFQLRRRCYDIKKLKEAFLDHKLSEFILDSSERKLREFEAILFDFYLQVRQLKQTEKWNFENKRKLFENLGMLMTKSLKDSFYLLEKMKNEEIALTE